jgi:hypothetical protein
MISTLIFGGITTHLIGSNLNYCNKLNNYGTIHNEYIIAMVGSNNTQFGVIKGRDSVCSNIIGPIGSIRLGKNFRFIAGGYNTNRKQFAERGIISPSVAGVTPVIGIDYEIHLYKSNNFEIVAHNLVSFGITTHSIGVNF